MNPRQIFPARVPQSPCVMLVYMSMFALLMNILLPATIVAQSNVQVLLKNGDHILGRLVPSHGPDLIGIQSDRFASPLEFRLNAIGSIDSKEDALANVDDELVFILNNHATFMGSLLELDDKQIKIKSRSLGEVVFPRKLLSEISAEGQRGKLLFAGPRAGQTWKSLPKENAWAVEGGAIVTSEPGQVLRCDASLGDKREVRIALSWKKIPNFVISMGTAKDVADPNKVQEVSTFNLETWGSTLVMVRNTETADFSPIGQITEESARLDLLFYIDEKKFEVTACTPGGKVLGKLSDDAAANAKINAKDMAKVNANANANPIANANPNVRVKAKDVRRPMIKLLNANHKGGTLRLERLVVREWSGQLPSQTNATGPGIASTDDQFHQGLVSEFAADQQLFKLTAADQTEKRVPLTKIERIFFDADTADLPIVNESVEVQFADGSSAIGLWKSLDGEGFELQLDGIDQPLRAALDKLMTMSGNALPFTPAPPSARSGVLEAVDVKLTGSLSESSSPGQLNWLPVTTSAASPLSQQFEGKVFYEATVQPAPQPAVDPRQAAARARALRGVRNPAQVDNAETRKFKPLSVGLTFRTGDVVNGKVTKIDEQGVTFIANDKTTTIAQNNMESITLVDNARITDLAPEKLKHLMTIPRAAKKDPPTHLFVSTNGDYLRGRLVKYAEGRVTAEIRLENVEFPADTIAQIYWLHSRDWEEGDAKQPNGEAEARDEDKKDEDKKNADKDKSREAVATQLAPSETLQVHALQRKEKALTFTPSKVAAENDSTEQLIFGQSELLGDCSVRVQDLTSLLISRNVGALVRKTQKDAWKLSVAALPKAYQESSGADESSSPLVGKPAPDFELKTTEDESFVLSKLQGRVVVLDFWASWCGPCMQTMPEVDRIVAELNSDQVALVTVNLQETKERAIAAMKRLKLSPVVALDIDGEVAQKYEASAIPQTVIIDREGKVTHLFVGGGAKFLEQFSEALTAAIEKK